MSRLDAYSDNSRRLDHLTCECGRERHSGADSCDRCAYLDGCRSAGNIISSLRGTDGLSIPEICGLLGHRYQNGGKGVARSILKSLQRLMRIGRVRRYWRDAEFQVGYRVLRNVGRIARQSGNSGCWVYALDGATAAEWIRRAA